MDGAFANLTLGSSLQPSAATLMVVNYQSFIDPLAVILHSPTAAAVIFGIKAQSIGVRSHQG